MPSLIAGLLVAAVLAIFLNGRGAPFVFDDLPSIVDNPSIRHFSTAFTPPADGSTVTGRPLLNLTFAFNYAVGGLNPVGYRLTNIAIHALATVLLFGIVRRTFLTARLRPRFGADANLLAGVSSLLWAVHPLQTESVTFVVQRAESLAALCILAALYAFIRGTETSDRARIGWLGLSVVATALGMAVKETVVVTPLLIVLYDRCFCSESFAGAARQRRGYFLCLAASWLVLAALVLLATGRRGTGAGLGLGVTPWQYLETQAVALARYLRTIFWPSPLVFDYGSEVVTSWTGAILPGFLVLTLLGVTLWALIRRPLIGFIGGTFFLRLAPSSSVIPIIGQTMAEHRLYLPLAAVVAGATVALYSVAGRGALLVGIAAATVLGFVTRHRNADYLDPLVLWTKTVAAAPRNYRAHYNLGVELERHPDRVSDAIVEYRKAVELEPRYPDAHNNLAVRLLALPGQHDDALAHLYAAIELRPTFATAHYNLANELARDPAHREEAIAHYQAALAATPDDAEMHNNLAVTLASIPGRLPAAIDEYVAALRLRPTFAEAELGLANVLSAIPARIPEAETHFLAALKDDPGRATAHFAFGAFLQQQGRTADAESQYAACLAINSGNAQAHFNLANLLAADAARLPDAIAHYEAAIRIDPRFVAARNNLAGAYYRTGRLDQAIAQLSAVLEIDPQNVNARRNFEMLRRQQR
ncbi:MAG TPA: tetratricopeptide repeat protein [Candidatus Didemnitutus sp.]|nr:tetratricopeptide repeat protein [Candidatus Didemnitutus sp.]